MSFCEAAFEMTTADAPELHCLDLQLPTLPSPAESAQKAALHLPVPLDEDDFKCSICLCLLYKPCVNSCGHTFCFWCIHLAMNALGSSQCPLCRIPYNHLPSVCLPLHHFIMQHFPVEAHQRAIDVAHEESQVGVQSPALPEAPQHGMPGEAFNCQLCGLLAYEPTVAICGHLFCQRCIVAFTCNGPINCPAPRCMAHIKIAPQVCIALHGLLRTICPEQHYSARAEERQKVLSMRQPTHVESSKKTTQKPFSPIEDMEAAFQDPDYIHFGILCDSCGAYPIIGHRWRCRDCPEKIGFDICGDCYNRQVHQQVCTGKFNQTHQPSHRMQLVDQVNDWLHELKAINPELSVTQILSLVTQAMEGGAQNDPPELNSIVEDTAATNEHDDIC